MPKISTNSYRAGRMLYFTLGFYLVAQSGTQAALADISLTPRMQRPMEKPQIARDLEGLESTEGGFSQGLRGSFVVKHYVSGPWKGGTAVIEIASDLSYAEIRIFDRDSNLQRIYSVQPKSDKTHINPAHIKNPLKMVEQVNADDAAQTHSQASTVTRSRRREAAVQRQTERAVQEAEREAAAESQSISGLLGQGSQQAENGSVSGLLGQRPVDMVVTPLKRGTVRGAGGEIREDNTAEEAPVVRRIAAAPLKPEPTSTEQVTAAAPPAKRTMRVRRKRHHKHHRNTLDVPLSGPAPKPKEEDEYYYEEVVVTDRRAGSEKASEEKTTSQELRAPAQEIQVAQIPHAPAREIQTPPVSEEEKNTGFIHENGAAESENTSTGEEPRNTRNKSSANKGSAAFDEANLPDVNQAVQESEAEKGHKASEPDAQTVLHPAPVVVPEKNHTNAGHSAVSEEVKSEPAASETIVAKPVKLPSDSWNPKATQVASLPAQEVGSIGAASSVVPVKKIPEEEIPLSEQIKRAQKNRSLASDSWSPQANVPHPSDAELGLTPLPPVPEKGARRVTKTGDELVPMSDQARHSGQVKAGEQWLPRAGSPQLDTQEERAQAMLNNLKPVMKKIVKVNRDVNNPEEGITPFYSLEKFSGAQYGRHREFERRVIYKQNKKSSVQGYDFYIDEVDRKQEKHYLYYYKVDAKTKKVKLIATEKHEKVSFLSNYDVGAEDKGKIVRD